MIEKIIEWSVKNRFLVITAFVFITVGGIYSMQRTPLDAIPDLSDVQVIIHTDYEGQSSQVVEDQVTYPLTTAMLNVPFAKNVRGYSSFGTSFVYIIFEDGTDMYWARSRVLEYLNVVSDRLPEKAVTKLGPDATGVGWVYEYVLEDKTGKHDLQELRSIQDWYLKYELSAVKGVSEVASIGGFVKQYQVEIDPNILMAYDLSINEVKKAIQQSNSNSGGKLIEMAETEFMVQGRGYIKSVEDIENIVLKRKQDGTPLLLKNAANVHIGPELRRGLAEWNGEGEVAGGIIVMRYGENALDVIKKVKERIKELEQGLPEGVSIKTGYDRSGLIQRGVDTLKLKLIEEMLVVALICFVFLLHIRSAFVAVFTLPMGILASFIIMNFLGINANIMSLGGIAIAIGVMVDASVVLVENAHKHLEKYKGSKTHLQIITDASREVGPALFYSLLIITVSFLPVFTLQEQSGKMFKPLAYTKTFAMAASSVIAITIIPVLMTFFIKENAFDKETPQKKKRLLTGGAFIFPWIIIAGAVFFKINLPVWTIPVVLFLNITALIYLIPQKIKPESQNPVSRIIIKIYRPLIHKVLKWKKLTIIMSLVLLIATAYPLSKLGSEFMPPLNEGDILYMPTTLPGISITKAKELLQQTDRIIKKFPEVEHVFGKVGRAETSTDPAPLSMIETTIVLKPKTVYKKEKVERFYSDFAPWLKYPFSLILPEEVKKEKISEWRKKEINRFFSSWPAFLKKPLSLVMPEERYITMDELTEDFNEAVQFPGLTNAWTMPIKTRTDMLSTGIKTPVGIKVMGTDLETLSEIGKKIEQEVKQIPGTLSAYSERITGANYIDFDIKRKELARYQLTVDDVQTVIMTAIGGINITTTVEGLERYPVNLRYSRDYRNSIEELKKVLVPTPGGAQIPLSQVAELKIRKGPAVIKSENGRRTAWIYVDLKGVDVGSYVNDAKKIINEKIDLPPGYSIKWSGQYEYMEKARKTLNIIVPATLIIIFILLYLHFNTMAESLIVMASLPFALIGGIWLIWLLGYNLSVAVIVGFIALAGLAAETGVVMIVYLKSAFKNRVEENRMNSLRDLYSGVIEGAVERVRPKIMTVSTTLLGLLPVMWGSQTGSQIMKRIAAPMVGGLISSTILTLIIIPAVFYMIKIGSIKKTN
jgi:Cu(I)/Ag(I) efflux system membrane protein CusA/SilA